MDDGTRNRCHICAAMHTARLTALARPRSHRGAAQPGVGRPGSRGALPDERMDAVRVFALRVLDTAGDVGDRAMRDFLAPVTPPRTRSSRARHRHLHDVHLANRLTGAPVGRPAGAYA